MPTPSSTARLLSLVRAVREISPRMEVQDLEVFLIVAERPGVTPREIEDLAGVTRTSASRAGYRLSSEVLPGEPGLGLVVIEGDPQDRRKKALYLSPRGQRFLNSLVDHLERK